MGDLVSLAGAILTLCCVLVLAYWCSRFLGKGLSGVSSGRNMKVIEQLRLGTDKQLLLLRLGSHTYLIGVSQAGIQMLAELEEEFEEGISGTAKAGFPLVLEEVLKKHRALYRKDKENMDE